MAVIQDAGFFAHPSEVCVGSIQRISRVSNDCLLASIEAGALGGPGETELSSNGVDLREICRETIMPHFVFAVDLQRKLFCETVRRSLSPRHSS